MEEREVGELGSMDDVVEDPDPKDEDEVFFPSGMGGNGELRMALSRCGREERIDRVLLPLDRRVDDESQPIE